MLTACEESKGELSPSITGEPNLRARVPGPLRIKGGNIDPPLHGRKVNVTW